MKWILCAAMAAMSAGCVCVPCEGAELFASPPARIVKTHGPWVLVQRSSGDRCWMYDSCYATRKLQRTGKQVLKDTVNVIGCTVETAGDVVVGAGALVVGAGHEILHRTHCAVKCLVCPIKRPRKPAPAKPQPPEVREEDLKPPTILIPEDDGERDSPAAVATRRWILTAR